MFSAAGTAIFAWLVLAAIVLGTIGRFLWWWRHKTYYKWSQIPFFFIYFIYTRLVWRATISRPIPVAPGQGAVIVCNHASSIDPWFIQLGVNRTVHWMVAREYSLHPAMAWIFRINECIPVNRGGVDTAATKMAIRYAQNGGLVGLFPEGRINLTKDLLLPGRPGAALIAMRARVPVIPCYVSGAPFDGTEFGCFLMTARTKLTVGDPIDLSEYYERNDKDVLQDVTKRFMLEIAKLSGATDYVPQCAGRNWLPNRSDGRPPRGEQPTGRAPEPLAATEPAPLTDHSPRASAETSPAPETATS
jgi:1-acyl-sn-glycerol-3-phosphate acyltransferase